MAKNKMLLSELIANAQRILDVHGDIPVEIIINNGEGRPVITTGYALKDGRDGDDPIIGQGAYEPIFYISG